MHNQERRRRRRKAEDAGQTIKKNHPFKIRMSFATLQHPRSTKAARKSATEDEQIRPF